MKSGPNLPCKSLTFVLNTLNEAEIRLGGLQLSERPFALWRFQETHGDVQQGRDRWRHSCWAGFSVMHQGCEEESHGVAQGAPLLQGSKLRSVIGIRGGVGAQEAPVTGSQTCCASSGLVSGVQAT